MANIALINGPNLNMLGSREPEVYGKKSLNEIESELMFSAGSLGHTLTCQQFNGEGEIVTAIQQAKVNDCAVMMINAGAYSHTSIAIRDALVSVAIPCIEIHISNIFAREEFRCHSYISEVADGVICGCGVYGYELALKAACELIK